MEKATFGAGCFWGVEPAFQEVKGVTATRKVLAFLCFCEIQEWPGLVHFLKKWRKVLG